MGDEDRDIWELYQTLRQLIDVLTAPAIDLRMEHIFNQLVRQLNEGFIKLFRTLLPKMNYFLHYERSITNAGPLSALQYYKFASKHKIFKKRALETEIVAICC